MERRSKRNQMTINKWLIGIPTVLLMTCTPTLYGQDFLKQLEAKLLTNSNKTGAWFLPSKLPISVT